MTVLLSTANRQHIPLALGICVLVAAQGTYFWSISARLVDGIRQRLEAGRNRVVLASEAPLECARSAL